MSENCNHDCASCGTTCGERTAPQSLLAPNNPSSNIKKVIAVIRFLQYLYNKYLLF